MGSDPWSHPKPHWQDVLDAAHKMGWPTPRLAKSHGGMTLNCPAGSDDCKSRIYSTGKGSEDAAKTALKKVRRCPHGNFADRFDRVDHNLDTADRLQTAAGLMLERADREAHALELLAMVDGSLSEAEGVLGELEDEYSSVVADEQRLSAELDAVLTTDDPSTTDDLVAGAHSGLRAADLELRELPNSHARHIAASERLSLLKQHQTELRKSVHRQPSTTDNP